MNWKIVIVLLSFPLLMAGCGSKDNFIILSPSGEGQVGALEIETEKGSAVLDEEGKAIFIDDRKSVPSDPTAVNRAETQALFQDALRVHPLMPQSFLLYFKHNSDQLTEGSQKLIPYILEAVRKRDSRDISIVGHTDRQGEDGYNRILSMERAQVVYDILRAQNVKGEEMTILYHGEGNLLIPTADEVAEPRNRRVEVMVR
ncbi:MAG: hypothetical protein A2X81_03790 [Desulfobacterales bacterium GWB2_56_26]|nr:MAG: hypothetical protein A2X81_03790 [Desulfobacterales bacterium GWB2_56_26]